MSNAYMVDRKTIVGFLTSLIAFLIVFVSVDGNSAVHNDITLIFQKAFHKKHVFLGGLNVFELVLIVYIISLISHSAGKKISMHRGMLMLLIIYLFDAMFYIINPNDNIIYYFDRIIIAIFVFAFAITPHILYTHIAKTFIKYICVFSLIRVFILFLFYINKYQVYYFVMGTPSINMEEDTNILFTFVGLLYFSAFLHNKRKSYLVVFFAILVFLFLTFRRTGLLTYLLSFSLLLSISFFYPRQKVVLQLKRITAITMIMAGMMVVGLTLLNTEKGQLYFGRYFAAFFDIGNDVDEVITKNVHLSESLYAFTRTLEGLPFWGTGRDHGGNLPISYGTSRGIHNIYVSTWMIYSFGNLLCLLLIIILFLYYAFKSIFKKKHCLEYTPIKLAIIVFLFVFFVNAWVLPLWNTYPTQSNVFRIILVSMLIRSDDINHFLKRQERGFI